MREKLMLKFVWMLPNKLVYWCAIRLMAHATQGEWGNESPTKVNIMTALQRWPSVR